MTDAITMRCTCGGEIGPDITDRPMCYRCGPVDMLPDAKRFARVWDGCAAAVEKTASDPRWINGNTIATPEGMLGWWENL